MELPTNLAPHPREELRSRSITVLLAMDLDLLRGALVSLLSKHADIEVVAALNAVTRSCERHDRHSRM